VNVLVLYPKVFKSYSKFERKVTNILKSAKEFNILGSNDDNGYIRKLFANDDRCIGINITNEAMTFGDITHAIIFDDGEEFPIENSFLHTHNIPSRIITISITRVININNQTEFKSQRSTPTYEYIGRGSRWGNPYSIFDIEDLDEGEDPRELVISNFKYDFEYDKMRTAKKDEIYSLAGKRLGCFCKPFSCHGDILADFLNSWDDEK
jgi:hypothetical protein